VLVSMAASFLRKKKKKQRIGSKQTVLLEISDSHNGEYEEDSFLEYRVVVGGVCF
jgi:hypothetical protein